ncbi:MAG TPA: PIN domain-containing protein [Acidimicrobiia bacterium]|nr:PIN domain-containing protein [Acidimicrobiia bacterium]
MLLVDTGVLLAAADSTDRDHARCAELLAERRGDLNVVSLVVAETAWQIERNLGPRSEAAFVRLITGGELTVVDPTAADWERAATLIETYETLRLGLVDASIVAVSERLKVTTLATLNQRDFAVVRPAHCTAFELIP